MWPWSGRAIRLPQVNDGDYFSQCAALSSTSFFLRNNEMTEETRHVVVTPLMWTVEIFLSKCSRQFDQEWEQPVLEAGTRLKGLLQWAPGIQVSASLPFFAITSQLWRILRCSLNITLTTKQDITRCFFPHLCVVKKAFNNTSVRLLIPSATDWWSFLFTEFSNVADFLERQPQLHSM